MNKFSYANSRVCNNIKYYSVLYRKIIDSKRFQILVRDFWEVSIMTDGTASRISKSYRLFQSHQQNSASSNSYQQNRNFCKIANSISLSAKCTSSKCKQSYSGFLSRHCRLKKFSTNLVPTMTKSRLVIVVSTHSQNEYWKISIISSHYHFGY